MHPTPDAGSCGGRRASLTEEARVEPRPATYLLLKGEGDSEDATSPTGSASCLRVTVLLAELRRVLLLEHERRVREGLV